MIRLWTPDCLILDELEKIRENDEITGLSIFNKKEVLWNMVRQFFKENKDLEKSDSGPPLECLIARV